MEKFKNYFKILDELKFPNKEFNQKNNSNNDNNDGKDNN